MARDDRDVREEEQAAAREAGEIGGEGTPIADEAERASAEHGGGVAEGFEQAEERLSEEATSDDGEGDPIRDAGEVEANPDPAERGEADQVDSTETDEETQGTPGDLDGSAG